MVTLNFVAFSTETCCDFLSIYDGNSTKAPGIAMLSGSPVIPPDGFTTTGPYMYLRFTSDSSDVDTGFSAIYTTTRQGERVR